MNRPVAHEYIELLPSRRAFFERHRHIFWRHEPKETMPVYEHVWDGEMWMRNLRYWMARPLTDRELALMLFIYYCFLAVMLVALRLFAW